MSVLELSKYTLREKFQIMEAIWDELRSHVDQAEIPDSHRKLLNERLHRIETGEAKLLSWKEAKSTFGKK